jgi:serine/threonine protein kinase
MKRPPLGYARVMPGLDREAPGTVSGDTVGPYRIHELLGQGGMGVVFRAVRESDGEVVALKILRDDVSHDDVFRRRFAREGEVARSLDHPHLVPVLDAGEAGGRHYLASRYVPGHTLAERLLRDGPLPVMDALRLVTDVGSALDALHRRSLVHRDVKPANILLDVHGGAALTDFGLARGAAHSILTQRGRVVGTIDYLAPELIKGDAATPASDIYALGCVLFECLVGGPPFGEREYVQACLAHLREPPPDPSAVRDDISSELSWALLQALAKEPLHRPATGTAYARLLRASAARA